MKYLQSDDHDMVIEYGDSYIPVLQLIESFSEGFGAPESGKATYISRYQGENNAHIIHATLVFCTDLVPSFLWPQD
jgi:hypothetical protein